ncbi:MAG: hypothetical protein NTY19_12760 [Planctomycetota bacterium]|nr:hypothetical protein [Planctomycetota bacterium]
MPFNPCVAVVPRANALGSVLRWHVALVCLTSVAGCGRAIGEGPPDAAAAADGTPPPVVYQVEIADPAFPAAPPRVLKVAQPRDRNGFPVGYAVRITTDVCMDKKCRTVEVTMHWNAVGYYDRLEYPPARPLTKREHEPFTAEDYAKLDRILKDRGSILARQSLAFLAKPVNETPGIDGWSGATPLTVQESVVEHAAYTTWVMWQWANGQLVQELCQLTEQSCTPAYLKQLLRSTDRTCVDFALKYVAKHHPSDVQFMNDVLHVVETGDREHSTTSLRFLKSAVGNKEELYAHLIRSACRMSRVHSPVVLDFLAGEPELPRPTLEELTSYLDQLSYFQIHLILRMLEQRKYCSAKTESDVSRLLAGDDFFIARRACEFLAKQKLGSETERKVQDFRARNRDRL